MAQKENVLLKALSEQIQNIGVEKIEGQLQRILDSPDFNATKQQRKFFQFVVNETLFGRAQEIKGYTIATCVFGRSDDFDQNSDPIVSVQANRLRRALERYYLIAGKTDPIRIDIPKGTYVPTFCEQLSVVSDTNVYDKVPDIAIQDTWPGILIQPFENLTGNPEKDFIGTGFSTELAVEVARFQNIKVLYAQKGQKITTSPVDTRFILNGNIREDSGGIKVAAYLTDTKTGRHIWGDTHRSGLKAAPLISFQEEVAQIVAAKIAGEFGIISKTLSVETKNKPAKKLKTYEAILQFYEYEQTLTPENFLRAMEALEHAANIEPSCGQVWTLLGHLYANIYSLDIPGFEKPLKKALVFALTGVRMNGENQRALATVALVHMFANELSAALAEVNRAFALNPNSLFVLDGLGYILTLIGEWEKGPALIKKVIKLNPYYRPVIHYALWLDYLRQENFERAYLEIMSLKRHAVFWYPLAKATSLGLLGRCDEGREFVKKLLELKPDFQTKGRFLIKHYIKFDDIVERVVEGLHRVGLSIE
jgi:TolB-like protein/Flp pilus assembly protein TadD